MRLTSMALIVAWTIPGPGFQAAALEPGDTLLAKAAFEAIDRDRWNKARRLGQRIGDATTARIIRWMDLTRRGSRASFREIARFVDENPDWPDQALLRRRAEEAMTGKLSGRALARAPVGGGFPAPPFRLRGGFTVPPLATFPAAPPKIPDIGFSPVRLQASGTSQFGVEPSADASGLRPTQPFS